LGVQELDACRELTVLKPEGTRRVGKPKVEPVEGERKAFSCNWRHKSQGQEEWRTVVEEAKVHQRLERQK
jgi:hypothetical protein